MKKLLSFLLLWFLFVGAATAQQNDFKTQGIPRPELQIQQEVKKQVQNKALGSTTFTFDDIKFWVGDGENQAALVVDWYYNGETAMVWGYRWDGEASGLDMITAIANADPNFLLLTQLTNLGNTIAGIGYGEPRSNIILQYDLEGASSNPKISFKFDNPNTFLGQTHCPTDPASEIASALQSGMLSGVIDHPFNYTNYGYACYDYDHWNCITSGVKWQSAWYDGYWSYLIKDDISEEFSYSGFGATLRTLSDGSLDALGFQDGWESWEGVNPREPFVAAEPPYIAVTGISLNTNSINLTVGEIAQLSATVIPTNTSNKNVTWSSNNQAVATIDENGLVSAISSGTANITATTEDGNFMANCTISVIDQTVSVTGISLNSINAELNINKTLQLIATVTPANATNKNITWYSDNESVATVNTNGLVTAIAEGTVNITATTEDGDFIATCTVIVTNPIIPVTNIILNVMNADLFVNETLQLIATVIPVNATNKNITWYSDNESVATVNANGLVTATGEGVTNISAETEDGNYIAYCNITVQINTTGIADINNASYRIYPTVTDGTIYISMEQSELIQVIDITGRVVISVLPTGFETTLSLSSYTNGVYFIKIGNNVSKIIKK